MAKKNETDLSVKLPYVITGVDEGIQLNSGVRLAFAGCGMGLDGFEMALKILKKELPLEATGEGLTMLSSQEDEWQDDYLESRNPVTVKEKFEEWATKCGVKYVGNLDFGDPKPYTEAIKGHLVRPPKIHVADTICLSCGGGEQVFNLRHYVLSADWLFKADQKKAKELIAAEIAYCEKVAGKKLKFEYEIEGDLDPKIAAINKEFAEKIVASL